MFQLGQKSLKNLEGVHPKLVEVVQLAIQWTRQDFTVFEGLRSPETQEEYLRRGVTRTRNSMHLRQPDGYGHAVDLVPWVAGAPRWEWEPIYWIALSMDAASRELGCKLVWGGVWDQTMERYGGGIERMKIAVREYCKRHPGPDFLDGPHYQLA